jgi:hypothetical protein
MMMPIRSPSLNPDLLVVAPRLNTPRLRQILCSRTKLPLTPRFPGSEAIIPNTLASTTPPNLSTSALALPSTRHARRSNPHS